MKTAKTNRKSYQDGFVAIVVTMIIMAIVTLIAVSFAFLTRRNQRENLDRQLSTQAFYAAEAGVNDAVKGLKEGSVTSINACNQTGASLPNQNLNVAGDVRYTCVLVDSTPTSLTYDSIGTSSPTVVHARSSNGTNISSIELSWADADPTTTPIFASNDNTSFYFPQVTKYNPSSSNYDANHAGFVNSIGVLRETTTPASAATSTDNLLDTSQTLFLYPYAARAGGGNTFPFRNAGNQDQEGRFVSGECSSGNTPRVCKSLVTGVGTDDIYLRLDAIYRPVAVTVRILDGTGNPLAIAGAQAVIDSTGRAQDVLRRVRVSVPLESSYIFPKFAVESAGTICKRYVTYPGGSEEIPPAAYLYDSSSVFSAGDANNSALDEQSCLLPGHSNIAGWP